ncbi:MAG TPA: selenoprotein O, partial [Deltaproteobacteria bacterium]|nr:selenoprotein O [Deltaproteobacteria bacterium]
RLCASWMAAGFVHGVLNTDNMNVTGESFDYGPWRFVPTYEMGFTAAYFDHQGLYAYGRQPDAVFWNLQRLAETLIDLSAEEPIRKALDSFAETFFRAYREAMLRRLGLRACGDDRDADILSLLRAFLEKSGVGYENFLFDWWGGEASAGRAAAGPSAEFYEHSTFAPLRQSLGTFEPLDAGRLSDDYFAATRPCTMLVEEVESLWDPIAENDDWTGFDTKVAEIRRMGAILQLGNPSEGAATE